MNELKVIFFTEAETVSVGLTSTVQSVGLQGPFQNQSEALKPVSLTCIRCYSENL